MTADDISSNVGTLLAEQWTGTQGALARRLDLAPAALRDRLSGRTRWSALDLLAVADLMGVRVSSLYGPRVDAMEEAL